MAAILSATKWIDVSFLYAAILMPASSAANSAPCCVMIHEGRCHILVPNVGDHIAATYPYCPSAASTKMVSWCGVVGMGFHFWHEIAMASARLLSTFLGVYLLCSGP